MASISKSVFKNIYILGLFYSIKPSTEILLIFFQCFSDASNKTLKSYVQILFFHFFNCIKVRVNYCYFTKGWKSNSLKILSYAFVVYAGMVMLLFFSFLFVTSILIKKLILISFFSFLKIPFYMVIYVRRFSIF